MTLSRLGLPFCLALALSGGVPVSSRAGDLRATPDRPEGDALCALALDLADFVAAGTGMAALRTCPAIGIGLPDGGAVARSQAGAFDPATGRIDLAPDLDLTTAFGQSYLVHELVHEAQYRTGRAALAPCPAALEAEAYAVQASFLRARGESDAAGTVTALGAMLGQCGETL
jgi:hypothetical protein